MSAAFAAGIALTGFALGFAAGAGVVWWAFL
jgi:hypothetical protein